MDLPIKIHSSHRSVRSMKETDNIKNYTEAENYLKLYNDTTDNKKESKLNPMSQSLEDNFQKLYMEDLAKVYQKCSFTYKPKFNDLSILSMKNTILSIIETNSVVVIQGPTGCGKSTQIPQFILDANIKKKLNCNIIVTQPRRIAAINVAKRVSQEGGWLLGSLVGYKVGMREKISCNTRLTYCTTGVFLHHLIYRKHMLDYTHVILDEIHERNQELDFLLLVVKKLLQTNSKQVKVILMSATIDVKKFAEYFSMRMGNDLVPAPIIKIPERKRFEIRTYYLDDIESLGTIPEVSIVEPTVSQTMINFCSRIIIALDQLDASDNNKNQEPQRHTVLVFLPGVYEIQELYNYLSSVYHKNKLWDLAILHSLMPNDEQHHIFHKPPEGHRRIILSTNIAESSITVPDIKYVIDFCLIKILIVDSTSNQSLQLHWASKANCVQRAGRVGRVMDGRVYRLVPKAFYDILDNESIPEMLRAPLTNIVLRAKVLDLDEPRNLLSCSLNPPTLSNLARSILMLKEIGALVNEDDSFQPFDGKLTNLGKIMAFLPLDIRISKLIMLGHVFGILRDAIILGASMSIKNVFNITQCYPSMSSYAIHKKWARDTDSDCIATLNIYKMWKNEKANRRITTYQAERQWAQRNGLQAKALHELDILVNDITDRLKKYGVNDSIGVNKIVWQAKEHDFVLQIILAGAFYPNYFIKRSQNFEVYKNNITMTLDTLDPTRTIYLKGWPSNQPGYLYAKKIQEIFSKQQGIPEKQIAVFFDTSKRVFVQFCKKETVPTDKSFSDISNFVYQAIKMKQCNVPIEIKLLNESEAKARAEYHNLWKFEQTCFFRKSKDFQRKTYEISKTKPELPELDVTCIPLFIQTIINPGYFWAILDDVTTQRKLQLIEKTLNSRPLEKLSFPSESTAIIAAPLRKNNCLIYHRAIIEKISSNAAELVDVFFIDYGCSSRVQYNSLRKIVDNVILQIPYLAFCCSLVFLRPSKQTNLQNQWSEISKNYFQTQIKGNEKIFGKIYSVVDSIINLELIVVNNKGKQLNVNESLIEKGYAIKREESYLSKRNHELRANINNINMSTEQKKFYKEMQYHRDDLLQYPDPPEEKDCQSSIRLQGPFSPLETELVQLTSTKKKAVVDMSSVNSVLLDDNPDHFGRLLVAQNISQLSKSNDLFLKNTTLLPNIPGLGALLILIFTPRMELRCDSRRTYYTGALCGLGPMNKYTAQAIYPEHDIGIEFDVEITIDDIKEINKLRFWMNIGMQFNENSMDENIINCQNKIKHILFELIDKQRKLQRPSIDYFPYQWNLYNEMYFLSAMRGTARNCDIYSLHKALELYERDEKTEKMLRHISKLQLLAYENIHKDTVTSCKLCKLEMLGLLELRFHLCSEQHKENEKTFLRQIKTDY